MYQKVETNDMKGISYNKVMWCCIFVLRKKTRKINMNMG